MLDMASRTAAIRLQSLWRGRSARRQRSASDTRELLPVSRVAPADSADLAGVALEDADGGVQKDADGTALVDASNYTSAHDLTRLAEHPDLRSIDTGAGTSSEALEGLASPDGAARRRLQLRALGMVAMSGVFFAVQGATVKLASDEPGGGTFEMVTVRGMVQAAGVLATNVWLRARGEHPLPVRHWLGVSWAQRKWLVLRALVGFAGIGFGFGAIPRTPLRDLTPTRSATLTLALTRTLSLSLSLTLTLTLSPARCDTAHPAGRRLRSLLHLALGLTG